ncbi:MAG: hypothetical protein HN348_19895, partial [Proteobacteria bacterium]|nr:hypothetical protein [Pseudomonadota bacterium]
MRLSFVLLLLGSCLPELEPPLVPGNPLIDYDGDGFLGKDECDDDDDTVHPQATEVCDGKDTDCNGIIDDVSEVPHWYVDDDGDGFGLEAANPPEGCDAPDPSGWASNDLDCDDSNKAINPATAEVYYDGVDQDCDGDTEWDKDGDGYECSSEVDTDCSGDDCDDSDTGIHPGLPEFWYDGIDRNCDGANDFDRDGDGAECAAEVHKGCAGDDCVDSDTGIGPSRLEIWYDGVDQNCDDADDFDRDGDGFRCHPLAVDPNCPDSGLDCVDTDGTINPGQDEIWYDGVDQNCDHRNDFDRDGDGAVCSSDVNVACPDTGGDCHDSDTGIGPHLQEQWYDGQDRNCDGANDYDQDGDGFECDGDVHLECASHDGSDCVDFDGGQYIAAELINPSAFETWYDGVDQNCDDWSDFDQDQDGHDCDGTVIADCGGHQGDDCNDTDKSIHGGRVETWYDGKDESCHGRSDFDQDGDGWECDGKVHAECVGHEGDDCLDFGVAKIQYGGDTGITAYEINPGASDRWYDNCDQNCDGANDFDQDGEYLPDEVAIPD